MKLSRRSLVLGLPVLSSGCVGRKSSSELKPHADRDNDGVPNNIDDYPTDDSRAYKGSRFVGSRTLQPGEYTAMALTNSEQDSGDIVKYEVTVTGSTGIDCLVFQRDAYDSYADGARDVSVMSEYSRLDVSETEVTEQIDKGEYMFVVDHTDLLTEPSTVPVEVSFVVQMIEPP